VEAHLLRQRRERSGGTEGEAQVQSATVEGHVVLTQQPAAKTRRAASGHTAGYSGPRRLCGRGEWLHLIINPRVEDGALQLTADKVDVSRVSGGRLCPRNVKASWMDAGAGSTASREGRRAGVALGGQGPSHVVSAEAQFAPADG